MKCIFCRQGEARPGEVTVTLERGETIIVFKNQEGFYRFNQELKGMRMEGAAGYYDTLSKFLVLYNDQTLAYSLTRTRRRWDGQDGPACGRLPGIAGRRRR